MRRVRQRQLRRAFRADPNITNWVGVPHYKSWRVMRRFKPGRLHGGQVGVGGLAPRLRVGNWMRGWNRKKPR